MHKHRIGVLGNSVCSEDVITLAEALGREIANRDGILICGGLTGVMEGAARGAKSAGGLTIGILPSENAKDANPYIDIPIVTGLGKARNVIVVLSSDVVIAVHGKYGTLTEIAYALHYGIPVIGLQTWDITSDIIAASNPAEAADKAFKLLER